MKSRTKEDLQLKTIADLENYRSCEIFLQAFKSAKTKRLYSMHLVMFCKFCKVPPDDLFLRTDQEIEDMLLRYIVHLKKVTVPVAIDR